jgi:hypothetical protein
MALLLLLKKFAPYIIAILAFVGFEAGIYWWGDSTGRTAVTAKYEAIIAARDKSDADAKQKATDDARKAEQDHAAALAAIAAQHQQEMQDAKAQTDKTLADLRDGNLRLRSRLAAATSDQHLPGAAAGSSGSDPSQSTGLQPADVQFLVQLAADADDAVRQLNACQAVVADDRKAAESP